MDSSLFILWLLMVKFGNCRGTLSFLLGLWKKEYFVVSTFSKSFLATSHSFIPVSSLFTSENRPYLFYGCKRDLHRLQTLLDQGDLKHNWNHWHKKRSKRGANIDPWGTSHFASFKLVFAMGSNSIYCFLFERKLSIYLW